MIFEKRFKFHGFDSIVAYNGEDISGKMIDDCLKIDRDFYDEEYFVDLDNFKKTIQAFPEFCFVYYDKEDQEKEMSFKSTNLFFHGDYSAPDKITVIGGKTGTTNAAGSCLILQTKDTGGNPYISVILRASQRTLLYEEMIDLLEEINN